MQIRYAKIPDALPEAGIRRICYEASEEASLYKIDGIARYLVDGTDRIWVDPEIGADPNSIRLFLLGPVLGTLLYRRGFLILQASCVEIDGVGVIFLGGAGLGKSTLAAACLIQGCRVLCDDLCVVRTVGEGEAFPRAVPSYPQLHLWRDTLPRLGRPSGALLQVRPNVEKLALPLNDGYSEQEIPIRKIYLLERSAGDVAITALNERDKLMSLMRSVYHASIVQQLWGEQLFFTRCVAMLKHVEMYQLRMSQIDPAYATTLLVKSIREGFVHQ